MFDLLLLYHPQRNLELLDATEPSAGDRAACAASSSFFGPQEYPVEPSSEFTEVYLVYRPIGIVSILSIFCTIVSRSMKFIESNNSGSRMNQSSCHYQILQISSNICWLKANEYNSLRHFSECGLPWVATIHTPVLVSHRQCPRSTRKSDHNIL